MVTRRKPDAKRIRRLNISSGLENSSLGDYEQVTFSPVLVKPPDERNVITVSTSSSAMDVSDAQLPQPWRSVGKSNSNGHFVDDVMMTGSTTEQVRGLPDEVFTGMEELGSV